MHSSVIGKVEKAKRYARETDRVSIDGLSLMFRGDNAAHRVVLEGDQWHCTCHYFSGWGMCAHTLAMQKILGEMLTAAAQTSFYPVGPDAHPAAELATA